MSDRYAWDADTDGSAEGTGRPDATAAGLDDGPTGDIPQHYAVGPVPPAHRTFRAVLFTVLVLALVLLLRREHADGDIGQMLDRCGDVTAWLWEPLLHGGGWSPLPPIDPAPAVDPSPGPGVSGSAAPG